jgi:excisionase family DNA binding protein
VKKCSVPLASRMKRMPMLMKTDEVADLLRTSRKAVYAIIERGQLPGVTRIGKRVLVRSDAL